MVSSGCLILADDVNGEEQSFSVVLTPFPFPFSTPYFLYCLFCFWWFTHQDYREMIGGFGFLALFSVGSGGGRRLPDIIKYTPVSSQSNQCSIDCDFKLATDSAGWKLIPAVFNLRTSQTYSGWERVGI